MTERGVDGVDDGGSALSADARLVRWQPGRKWTRVVLELRTGPQLSACLTDLMEAQDVHLELDARQIRIAGLDAADPLPDDQPIAGATRLTIGGLTRPASYWYELLCRGPGSGLRRPAGAWAAGLGCVRAALPPGVHLDLAPVDEILGRVDPGGTVWAVDLLRALVHCPARPSAPTAALGR